MVRNNYGKYVVAYDCVQNLNFTKFNNIQIQCTMNITLQ